ncbi:MAG TPA: LLM class flavin-dependent oxidoreductase [Ktedonobacteraceae bacterium]|jgi:alkanesulfonate monooxygenase SsuD/methylene tetrahydromethanopterin reductase-like flavin-dependent oxidoreductase (luciferase family)
MNIGIGFPAWIPQINGAFLIDWATAADAGPFSTLGLIDRVVYTNYEPLIALAGAAGATRRIRLATTVLLAPLREPALLAKQSASLDALSGGRLTLGLGVGAREDDFLATSTPFRRRGKRFDEQLALMTRLWSGQSMSDEVGPIGPAPVQGGGPEILLGGYSPAAIERLRHWGKGFMAGGGDAELAQRFFRLAQATWREAGRPGKPRLVGCAYFALGPDAQERGAASIQDYYAFAPEHARRLAAALPASPAHVRARIEAYRDAGADELILWPTIAELEQVARLAEIVGT